MKFEPNVAYENISDKVDKWHCPIKIKVTVGLRNFSPFTTIQTIWSYNSTLIHARKLIFKHVCSSDNNTQYLWLRFANTTIENSSESVYVSLCVCVFLHDNSKRN